MTVLVFLLVVLAAILHAGWNFAAKQAAGNPGALWLGVCLGAVLSWPCAVLAHQAEPLTLAGLPYIGATGILHAWYFGFLSRSYMMGDISLGLIGVGSLCTYLVILFTLRLGPVSYIVAVREFAVVIGSILGFVVLKERLTVRKGIGIAAITLGLVLVKMV